MCICAYIYNKFKCSQMFIFIYGCFCMSMFRWQMCSTCSAHSCAAHAPWRRWEADWGHRLPQHQGLSPASGWSQLAAPPSAASAPHATTVMWLSRLTLMVQASWRTCSNMFKHVQTTRNQFATLIAVKAQIKGRLGHKPRKEFKEAKPGWLLQISNTFKNVQDLFHLIVWCWDSEVCGTSPGFA